MNWKEGPGSSGIGCWSKGWKGCWLKGWNGKGSTFMGGKMAGCHIPLSTGPCAAKKSSQKFFRHKIL